MNILDIFLDILLKPPQSLMGLFFMADAQFFRADAQFFGVDLQFLLQGCFWPINYAFFAAGLLLAYKLCIFLLLDYFHPRNDGFV